MKLKSLLVTAPLLAVMFIGNQSHSGLAALEGDSITGSIRYAKPATFCFSAYKVVKTKKYGKLKCSPYPTPRGVVWMWTRI